MFEILNGKYALCDECPSCIMYYDNYLKEPIEDTDHYFCEKTDTYFYCGDYCDEAFVIYNKCKVKKQKTYIARNRGTRRYTSEFYKKKVIQKCKDMYMTYYPFGKWYDPQKGYIVDSHRSNRQRYYKRLSNKKIRRNKLYDKYNPSAKRAFHKLYDYWWEVY